MTAVLSREVPMANHSMFGKLIVGSFLVGVLISISFAPRTRCCSSESKVDRVKLTVSKFANEAFPQWHRTYDGCPHSLYELTEFMNRVQTTDPWGQPYRMACRNDLSWRSPIRVWSIGEDGIADTSDDIRSWD